VVVLGHIAYCKVYESELIVCGILAVQVEVKEPYDVSCVTKAHPDVPSNILDRVTKLVRRHSVSEGTACILSNVSASSMQLAITVLYCSPHAGRKVSTLFSHTLLIGVLSGYAEF